MEVMDYMFYKSKFNKNISNWDVSKTIEMKAMFESSSFNSDIFNWNVSCVKNMSSMFKNSKFNQPLSQWNVSNVMTMYCMFENSLFNQELSNWDISKVEYMSKMFHFCPSLKPWWYIENTIKRKEVINERKKIIDFKEKINKGINNLKKNNIISNQHTLKI